MRRCDHGTPIDLVRCLNCTERQIAADLQSNNVQTVDLGMWSAPGWQEIRRFTEEREARRRAEAAREARTERGRLLARIVRWVRGGGVG